MEKLIIEMEKYRKEALTMDKGELEELQRLSNEFTILSKHASEKITIDKHDFNTYVSLFAKYKEIAGFTYATNFVVSYNKENDN